MAASLEGGAEGLTGYLQTLARKHPVAFATLLGKVLPLQIANADGAGAFKTENVIRIEFVAGQPDQAP